MKKNTKKIVLENFCNLSEINNQMISFCRVLADPTRFKIVNLLRNGSLPVQEIASNLKKTNSNISHQLRLLRLKNVVDVKQVANFRLYELTQSFHQRLSSFLKEY